MERKKRSKGRGWESCYVKKMYGTFGVEMRAYGQKLVQFCKHTHTHAHVSYSSIDMPQAAKCKWRALRHMPGGHAGKSPGHAGKTIFCGRYLITLKSHNDKTC